MTRKIHIFDTTLRDGEQSPGASMNAGEKLRVTSQLLRLKVDAIEAGFPISSPGDFESVRQIAQMVGDQAVVCALTRAVLSDIDCAAEALADCKRPRIHTGIGVSQSHLRDKLHITPDEAVERAVAAVKYARRFCDDVEFYAEDAGRSDYAFLARILEAAIRAGATIVNIPETTGFSMPDEFGRRVKYVMENVDGIDDVMLSVHCHNDLGMATALALAGVANGATQVECTINGLGERAGNTALEEVVMAIRVHGEELDAHTDIEVGELVRASRLISSITGIGVQPNKAIVGGNAFSHSSGIHQDGIIKEPSTYEIIDPDEVGAGGGSIILTARSGRAALSERLRTLGYDYVGEDLDRIYKAFLAVADKKREVYDGDLDSIVAELDRVQTAFYSLKVLQVSCGSPLVATATATLVDREGNEYTDVAYGTGPVDATYKVIDKIIHVKNDLAMFTVQAVSRGIDALGEVTVRIKSSDGGTFSGRAADGDIIVASAKAYLDALNRLLIKVRGEEIEIS